MYVHFVSRDFWCALFLLFTLQSSVKMKLLCVQVIKDILGEGIDVSFSTFMVLP